MNHSVHFVCLSLTVLGLLGAAALFCSFGGKAPQTVTGHVNMYGNEPFAFPGFQTEDGKTYTLVVDENKSDKNVTLKRMQQFQGELLELTGKTISLKKNELPGPNILKDGQFIVYSYKDISNPSFDPDSQTLDINKLSPITK